MNEDQEKLKKASELLKSASDMLLSVRSGSGAPNTTCSTTTRSGSIAETLVRARSMMQTSTNTGFYRRLNRNERLRAAAAATSTKSKKEKKSKPLEKKPFEFALLRAKSEESDEEDAVETLKKENIVERGMIELAEDDSEATVRAKVASSLKSQYSLLGPNDFEFVKVTQKTVSVLRLAENTEYNYNVVKKLAGQGLLYIRVKQAFDFVLTEQVDLEEDQNEIGSYQQDTNLTSAASSTTSTITSQIDRPSISASPNYQTEGPSSAATPRHHTESSTNTTHQSWEENGSKFYQNIVSEFPASVIVEPTEMLRYLQCKIVYGRPLDRTNDESVLEGETNFIAVDRDNVLETTFDELRAIQDPRITFQVEFYGEMAQDSGGPRREWIRLCNQHIKRRYFENGLKEHLSEDYFFVGQMAAIALLQNGQAPKYFSEDLLQDIFVSEEREVSPCVLKLREGLDSLGIHMFGRRFPLFLYLLRPAQNKAALTVPMLIHLLTAKFSEEGSNSLIYEKAVYGKFVKYVREVASGRRVTSLENILEFVTGASEEPTLGFDQQPCIEFVLATVKEAKIDRTEDDTGNNSTDGEVSLSLCVSLTLIFKTYQTFLC